METRMTLAGVPLLVRHETAGLRRFCADYLDDADAAAEGRLHITLTSAQIEAERTEERSRSESYLESLALCREFCRLAVGLETLLFHSSAIAVDGSAYLFAAPSGTGKSTHTALWRRYLGERAVMVNDDKPFLRRQVGIWYAYGSPWNGKHRLSAPIRVPIRGICLLDRGSENRIVPIGASAAFPRLFAQTQRAVDEVGMKQQMELLTDLAKKVPLWHLHCTPAVEAARLAYETMVGGNK